MRRTTRALCGALSILALAAGCTAAGAQSLTAPTISQLVERIDKQDTKIAALEADMSAAKVRAKTALAIAKRAEGESAELAEQVAALEAQRFIEQWAHTAFHDDVHEGFGVFEGNPSPRHWQMSEPTPWALRVEFPDIEGVTFTPNVLTWAAGTEGSRSTTITVASGTYGSDDPKWIGIYVEPTVTLGDHGPVKAFGRMMAVRNMAER